MESREASVFDFAANKGKNKAKTGRSQGKHEGLIIYQMCLKNRDLVNY